MRKYKVITLCGSTRFKDQFLEAQKRLTLEGNIVISVGLFGHSGDSEVWENMDEGTLTAAKAMLDDMHKAKIDTACKVYEGPDALQQPAGRVGNPMDIANMVMFLWPDKAGFITGENICIDGGMTKLMIYHGDHGWTFTPKMDSSPTHDHLDEECGMSVYMGRG